MNCSSERDGSVPTKSVNLNSLPWLEITVHRDTVTLRGERQDEPEDARAYHRRERGRGSFGRTFGLPFPVDPDQVGAKLSDGVLILTLQRPEQDKPKRIRISAG